MQAKIFFLAFLYSKNFKYRVLNPLNGGSISLAHLSSYFFNKRVAVRILIGYFSKLNIDRFQRPNLSFNKHLRWNVSQKYQNYFYINIVRKSTMTWTMFLRIAETSVRNNYLKESLKPILQICSLFANYN